MNMLNAEDSFDDGPPLQPPALSQKVLDFGRMSRGRRKTLQQLITNTNKQPIIWLAAIGGIRWLTLEPVSGVLQPGEQRSIDVTVDTTYMEVGENTVTLTFSSEGDESSMSTDIVSKAVVEDEGILQPLAAGLDFGNLLPQSSSTIGLLIKNPTNKTVDWNIKIEPGRQEVAEHQKQGHAQASKNIDLVGKGALTLDRDSGKLEPDASKTVYVTVNANRLDTGYSYTATLILTSNAEGYNPASVGVPIAVYVDTIPQYDGGPKPPESLPLHLTFGLSQEGPRAPLTLDMTNSTNEPCPNLGPIDWTLRDLGQAPWLTIEPSEGRQLQLNATTRVEVTPIPETEGLVVGRTYTTTLQLTLAYNPPIPGHGETTIPIPVTLAL